MRYDPPKQRVAFDRAEWGARVGAALPGATASIVWSTATAPPAYVITIGWTDRRVNTTYSTTGDAESFQYVMTKAIFPDPA